MTRTEALTNAVHCGNDTDLAREIIDQVTTMDTVSVRGRIACNHLLMEMIVQLRNKAVDDGTKGQR